jgi:predicted nucleotide-binding protein
MAPMADILPTATTRFGDPSRSALAVPAPAPETTPIHTADPNTIFLIHGRNFALYEAIKEFLHSLGLRVIDWEEAVRETGETNPVIHDVREKGLELAFAVVVLFSHDDLAMIHPDLAKEENKPLKLQGQPRQNVTYEAGIAITKYKNRTVLVAIGEIRSISDVAGKHLVKLNNSSEQRLVFINRLKVAGCIVVDTSQEWISVGNFENVLGDPPTVTKPQPIVPKSPRSAPRRLS